MITVEESFAIIQKLLLVGFETKTGIFTPRGFSGRSGLGGAHPLLPASTGTLVGVALKAADT